MPNAMMPSRTIVARKKKFAERQMDLAEPVSQRVQLEHVILLETSARRGELREALPGDLSLSVKARSQVRDGHDAIHAIIEFSLRADYEESAEAQAPFEIAATYLLVYEVPSLDGIKDENVRAFGELNGVFNAWPYWREFVQATTVRMGLPPLTVPVYRPLSTVTTETKGSNVAPKKAVRSVTKKKIKKKKKK